MEGEKKDKKERKPVMRLHLEFNERATAMLDELLEAEKKKNPEACYANVLRYALALLYFVEKKRKEEGCEEVAIITTRSKKGLLWTTIIEKKHILSPE